MFTRDLTIWILVVAILLAVLYNVAAGMWWNPGGTISETFQFVAQRYPLLPFLLGLLLGHLLWPMQSNGVHPAGPIPPDAPLKAPADELRPPEVGDFKPHIKDL